MLALIKNLGAEGQSLTSLATDEDAKEIVEELLALKGSHYLIKVEDLSELYAELYREAADGPAPAGMRNMDGSQRL